MLCTDTQQSNSKRASYLFDRPQPLQSSFSMSSTKVILYFGGWTQHWLNNSQ